MGTLPIASDLVARITTSTTGVEVSFTEYFENLSINIIGVLVGIVLLVVSVILVKK